MSSPFSLTESRYDMNTFAGRFKHFVSVVDPSMLMHSDDMVSYAAKQLNQFRSTGVMPASNEEMWRYRALTDSAIHPTSNDVIPRWFRMSGIAPVNIPIVFGMLACPPSSTAATMMLHFINQSYNTGCNYFNRSGADMSHREIGTAYTLAVGSACAIAYGLGKAATRNPFLKRFGVIIPCVATCAASVSNLALTRASEMTHGVPVIDMEGKVLGSSMAAGVQGVVQSAISRCVLVPSSVLLFPPVIIEMMKRANLFPKRSRPAIILAELSVISVSLLVALPASLAVFPQTLRLKATDLEPEFHNRFDSQGKRIEFVTANKGL